MFKTRDIILLISVLFLLFVSQIEAAATWTQQPGFYHLYKVGTTSKYLSTTEILIPSNFIKQNGVYILCKSGGGLNKYWPQGSDCTGKLVVSEIICDTQFVCHDQYGLTVNLKFNTALDCPKVNISKDQIARFYDGTQVINGNYVCPN